MIISTQTGPPINIVVVNVHLSHGGEFQARFHAISCYVITGIPQNPQTLLDFSKDLNVALFDRVISCVYTGNEAEVRHHSKSHLVAH